MSIRILLLLGFVSSLAAAPRKGGPTDDHLLQGTWVVTAAEKRAEKVDDLVGSTIEFVKDRMTINSSEGTFQLDGAADPKALDLQLARFDKPVLGIYRLDGDKLLICLGGKPDEPRPTKFETHKDREVALLKLKREKRD